MRNVLISFFVLLVVFFSGCFNFPAEHISWDCYNVTDVDHVAYHFPSASEQDIMFVYGFSYDDGLMCLRYAHNGDIDGWVSCEPEEDCEIKELRILTTYS